jgi:tRNA1Val (adenine37-N6)-methyltransferase
VISTPKAPPPDTLFGGAVTLHQPARGQGYRVNVDAVLLAAFAARERRARRAVDLGAGVGAVGLCLLHHDRAEHVLFAEEDREAHTLCRMNLEANGWQARGEALCVDVSNTLALPTSGADLVVCNPPYVPPGRGRPPVVGAKARLGDLAIFTRAARCVLGVRGRACFVYPAPEIATLLETLRNAGLEPKRMRLVHSDRDEPARVALVEALAGKPGGLVVLPPLVERDGEGPSDELVGILRGRGATR